MYRQLNSTKCPENAIANVLYQKLGWARMKRKAEEPHKTCIQIIQAVSEIELINLTELELSDPSHKVLDMNQINITYRNLFCENRLHTNQVQKQTRQLEHIKTNQYKFALNRHKKKR